MADSILLDGDIVNFKPAFGPALVLGAQPAKLRATGGDPVFGRKMCVEGDERTRPRPGCTYMTPQFSRSRASATSRSSSCTPRAWPARPRVIGRKVLLKGLPFIARFQVPAPAMMVMPHGPAGSRHHA